MKLELHIAWRYLFSKKGHNAINIVSGVSAAAVGVVAAAMVCVLSVMNGFGALVEQMFQTRVMEAQGYAAQAQQLRMQAMQRQMEVSRQIARDSAEISAGIMDSWEKRSASQSRMSANYSEAVRGVNTYTTPTGRTVECSVTADHVYQNRYGDTIGVSGSAVDPEVAVKLEWTELKRK